MTCFIFYVVSLWGLTFNSMKYFISLVLVAMSFNSFAQETITYPYNPDGNADSLIGVPDLQDLLSNYGNPFAPSEILYNNEPLAEVLFDILNQLDSVSDSMNPAQNAITDLYFSEEVECSYPGKLSYDLTEGFRICKYESVGDCTNHVLTNCTGENGTSSAPMYMSFDVSDTIWLTVNSLFKGNACSYNNYGTGASTDLLSFPSFPEWDPATHGWGLSQQHGLALPGRTFIAKVDPNEYTHLTEVIQSQDQGPFQNIRFWNSSGVQVNQFYAAYGGCGITNGYYTTSGSIIIFSDTQLIWSGL